MTLQRRFMLLALLIFTLLTSIVVLGSFFTWRLIVSAQRERQSTNEVLAQHAVQEISQLQSLFAKDYSFWDDMAVNVTAGNVNWIQQEFFGPLEIYETNAVWVVTRGGAVLYTQQRDSSQAITLPFQVEQVATLVPGKEVETYYSTAQDQVIAFKVAPIFYHTQPVEAQLPVGYLVLAKVWDEELVQRIEKLTSSSVELVSPTHSEPENHLHVDVPLLDWQNQTVGLVSFVFKDQSVTLLTRALIIEQLLLFIFGFVTVGLVLFLLNNWVVIPVTTLIAKISAENKGSSVVDLKQKSEFEVLHRLTDDYITQNQANKRLSLAIEAATEAVVITNSNREIIYVNPAWEKLNGYSLQEALGKNPRILASGKTPREVYKIMWDRLERSLPFSTEEVINRRKDGTEYTAFVSVYPMTEDGINKYYVGLVQDISQRKEVERMKTEFISLASHQLRTPLSAIRWFSELLFEANNGALTEKQHEIALDILGSTKRMIALVNDLLNISRLETGRLTIEPRVVDVRVLMAEIKKTVSHKTEQKNIDLNIAIAETVQPMTIDPALLEEALINLIGNAIKYTPEGGHITVEVKQSETTTTFNIQDNGIGIPLSDQDHLFSRFFRASNAHLSGEDGSGLGLYVVKMIINALGGVIKFTSVPDQGSLFVIELANKGVSAKQGEVGLNQTEDFLFQQTSDHGDNVSN